VFSALEVFYDNARYKSMFYLLTYNSLKAMSGYQKLRFGVGSNPNLCHNELTWGRVTLLQDVLTAAQNDGTEFSVTNVMEDSELRTAISYLCLIETLTLSIGVSGFNFEKTLF